MAAPMLHSVEMVGALSPETDSLFCVMRMSSVKKGQTLLSVPGRIFLRGWLVLLRDFKACWLCAYLASNRKTCPSASIPANDFKRGVSKQFFWEHLYSGIKLMCRGLPKISRVVFSQQSDSVSPRIFLLCRATFLLWQKRTKCWHSSKRSVWTRWPWTAVSLPPTSIPLPTLNRHGVVWWYTVGRWRISATVDGCYSKAWWAMAPCFGSWIWCIV